ncbi:glycosyltransferase [Roseivirga seohaensis]|uniref:glycosyltransferase n=1 Tax=Roseivirga seohaensis TaxID=1914963 RepID=UPI003BAD43B5
MFEIALVTPVKNEIDNLPRFLKALKDSEVVINTLIIVENDSDDGSKEYLEKITELDNVKFFHLLEKKFENKEYSIGFKYSEIINYGFDYLKNLDTFDDISYVGILDSDCFIEPNYYSQLANSFQEIDGLGITCGIIKFDDGKIEKVNKDQVRGTGRLWSKECFLEMGDYYGLSPDSISMVKARLSGYEVQLTENAFMYSRPVNSRGDKSFRGRSAYYNGVPFSFILMKSIACLFVDISMSKGLIKGYFLQRKSRVINPDKAVLQYNRSRLRRRIKHMFR